MSWPLVIVIIACLASFVATLAVVMPYLRPRGPEEVKAQALADLNKRLETLEAATMSRLPAGMPRRIG